MKSNLFAIRDALAGLTDTELHAIASNEAPRIAYGLLVWIQAPSNNRYRAQGATTAEALQRLSVIDTNGTQSRLSAGRVT